MWFVEYRAQGQALWWRIGTARSKAGALAKLRAHRKRFGFGGMFRDEYRVVSEVGA